MDSILNERPVPTNTAGIITGDIVKYMDRIYFFLGRGAICELYNTQSDLDTRTNRRHLIPRTNVEFVEMGKGKWPVKYASCTLSCDSEI